MRAPSCDEIRPDAIVLVDVVQVDITWALEGAFGANFAR